MDQHPSIGQTLSRRYRIEGMLGQGQAILMDFGIVKILGGEVADHHSDIYSLGVALYEMLSSRPPFVADSAMKLIRYVSQPSKFRNSFTLFH